MAKGRSHHGVPDKLEPVGKDKQRVSRNDWYKRIQEMLQFYKRFDNREQNRDLMQTYDYITNRSDISPMPVQQSVRNN